MKLCTSLERAQECQREVEAAETKLIAAKNHMERRLARFKNMLEEVIEDDPQLLKTNAWLLHHALNTLGWNAYKIASVLGVSVEHVVAGWRR
jgi:hypothetical protein